MQKLIKKCRDAAGKGYMKVKKFLSNTDGDQITGWLIVILLVVVVGAFFLEVGNKITFLILCVHCTFSFSLL